MLFETFCRQACSAQCVLSSPRLHSGAFSGRLTFVAADAHHVLLYYFCNGLGRIRALHLIMLLKDFKRIDRALYLILLKDFKRRGDDTVGKKHMGMY